ncbi:MAG TPA: hypothetical protein VH951_09150 [Dehalococcoidia bacterium]
MATTKGDEITTAFRARAALESRELFLGLKDAKDFVEECQANAVSVVGIEGFFWRGKRWNLALT